MRRPHCRIAILYPFVAAGLVACGGGGGGGNLIPNAWVNPQKVTLSTYANGAPVQSVRVGVADTGFLTNHFEIRDRIVAAQEFGGTGTLEDDKVPHGTEVAMLIAGQYVGYSGNTDLVLAKVADRTGVMYTDKISAGAQWAMDQGAKVMNFSLGPMYVLDAFYLPQMYNKAVTMDVALVMAAGNENQSVSTLSSATGSTSIFTAGQESFKNLSLVVGATSGNAKAAYSNFAGDDPNVQARFLVAQGLSYVQKRDATAPASSTGGLGQFSGTSASTAIVTAAAATVRAYWPHLSAQQTAQILLDSADRSFTPLYSQGTCGPSSNVDCGLYYFGQGKLSLSTALQPLGAMSVPIGSSLDGTTYALGATGLMLPAAFGDALQGKAITAALFDRYARDFRFDLASRFSTTPAPSFAHTLFGQLDANTVRHEAGPVAYRAAFDRSGAVTQARFDLELGPHIAHFHHGKGSAPDPYDSPLPMASLAGSGSLGRYDLTDGAGLRWRLGDTLSVEGNTIRAETTAPASGEKLTASRHELGLGLRPAVGTTVTFGLAATREQRAMLGASGSGALALAGSSQQAAFLTLRRDLGHGWAAFGQAERGTLGVQGQGLLTRISDAMTSHWGAGLAWRGDDRRLVLAVSQPLRVESATAHFVVPLGRTPDGGVIQQSETVSLVPSGRQINVEIAYQQRLDRASSFNLNVVRAQDDGHVAGRTEWTVVGAYRRAW